MAQLKSPGRIVKGESRTPKDAADATNNLPRSVRETVAQIRAEHDTVFGDALRTGICIECRRAETPHRWQKCKSCHASFINGYHRIVGSPFYLAPLRGNR